MTLSEMCMTSNIGAKIKIPQININSHKYLFGEDQSRYIIEIKKDNKKEVCDILQKNAIYYEELGITQKENMELDEIFNISVKELNEININFFNKYFNEGK